MLFNSIQFLLFFPAVLLLYFVLPLKIRYIWLLIASYFFYMCWNAKYALLILFSTLTTWLCGILSEKAQTTFNKRLCLASAVSINFLILFFFKYFNFALDSLNTLLAPLGLVLNNPHFDIILPVGISFYTFQAVGYTIDVYRGEIRAEKNILRYALFISFFPQLVAGPIERSKNLLAQMHKPARFNVQNARIGLFTMAYGFILKLVIADRAAMIINPIIENYEAQTGAAILFAVFLFAFQIYCDFHGYTQIAIGSAKVLGFNLQENFKEPYLSFNIQEFWRNWHISLTSWFKDYLYIPLGGSRNGKIRTYLNTFAVFLLSGLWHGAAWNFVAWGGLNGAYLIGYNLLKAHIKTLRQKLGMSENSRLYKAAACLFVFLLTDYGWLYFRASSLTDAFKMQIKILTDLGSPMAIRGKRSGAILLVFIVMLLATDFMSKRGINWKEKCLNFSPAARWLIYFLMLFILFFFGIYEVDDAQTQFIYFQF